LLFDHYYLAPSAQLLSGRREDLTLIMFEAVKAFLSPKAPGIPEYRGEGVH
jgi:hypothetical protein